MFNNKALISEYGTFYVLDMDMKIDLWTSSPPTPQCNCVADYETNLKQTINKNRIMFFWQKCHSYSLSVNTVTLL